MVLLPRGTAQVCRGKPIKSIMPDPGRNLSKTNSFLATDDISNIPFPLGTCFAWHKELLFIREEGIDVCPLCAPKPPGTIKAKSDKDPIQKNLGTGSFSVWGLSVFSKAKPAAVETHTFSVPPGSLF